MRKPSFRGLFAATLTPLADDGSLMLSSVAPLVDHLVARAVDGLYVCGSTGEGVSLSTSERKQVAKAFVTAADQRVPVMVQVGHNSLAEASDLAAHAASISATAVSATCPSYFKINTVEILVECMAQIAAAAPQLPFYYYHIPSLTGNKLNMPQFLELGRRRIPNLAGIKFTTPEVHEFQQCLMFDDQAMDVFWGFDEMLLSALVVGGSAGIGSTYNIAAPLYKRMMAALAAGDLKQAAADQYQAVLMIDVLLNYPFHAALKQILSWQGIPLGTCRLPHKSLSPALAERLRQQLDALGFFQFCERQPSPADWAK